MSPFVILVGGRVTPTLRLARQIDGARVIAADSGIRHATSLGLTPELWVGDFDSSNSAEIARWASLPRLEYPADKDMTDSDLAIAAALDRGAGSLLVVGAFGGMRSDHAFLHMTQALALAERALPVRLTSGDEEGLPLRPGLHEPDLPAGTRFSLLPFTDLRGLTIMGAKWPLAERNVPFGSTLTLSNIAKKGLSIRLGEGRAFLVAHPAGD